MEMPQYKVFRGELKEFLDPQKEIAIHHFTLKKSWGDW